MTHSANNHRANGAAREDSGATPGECPVCGGNGWRAWGGAEGFATIAQDCGACGGTGFEAEA